MLNAIYIMLNKKLTQKSALDAQEFINETTIFTTETNFNQAKIIYF